MTGTTLRATAHSIYIIFLLLAGYAGYSQAFIAPHKRGLLTTEFRSRSFIALSSNVIEPATSTTQQKSSSVKSLPYKWKDQWYALTFASYIPNPSESAETTAAAVFGHPLVLWKGTDNGPISCADDICPHRSSALTEGRVRDGNVECLYHGWQFRGVESGDDKKGSCSRIPQLEKGAEIPKRACLKMREVKVVEGIVFVWMGDSTPTFDPPRQGDGLDELTGTKKGFLVNDFQIDLPYDHSYLIENLIDPAHIPISHDRTPGGGKRENAQAYEMIVDEDSISEKGFTGRYRNAASKPENGPFIEVKFDAPGIIRQRGNPRGNIMFGAALHCMPLAIGRSRLLFRTYVGGLPWFLKLVINAKPKWLRNLNSCKILEQDVGLITTQEDHFARNKERSLKEDFLLLSSSDLFVGAYRRWMDCVGHGMPWFQGLANRSNNVYEHLTGTEVPPGLDPANHRSSGQANVETRYHRHVMKCPETRNALHKINLCKKVFLTLSAVAIIAASTLAPIASNEGSKMVLRRALKYTLPLIPVFPLITAFLHALEKQFYVSFKRSEQLRTEKGV